MRQTHNLALTCFYLESALDTYFLTKQSHNNTNVPAPVFKINHSHTRRRHRASGTKYTSLAHLFLSAASLARRPRRSPITRETAVRARKRKSGHGSVKSTRAIMHTGMKWSAQLLVSLCVRAKTENSVRWRLLASSWSPLKSVCDMCDSTRKTQSRLVLLGAVVIVYACVRMMTKLAPKRPCYLKKYVWCPIFKRKCEYILLLPQRVCTNLKHVCTNFKSLLVI